MTKPLHCIVLAAGQGSRMKSARPKVLQTIGGETMLGHVLAATRALHSAAVHIVYGHGGEQVQAWLAGSRAADLPVQWAHQAEQKGTAHAVQQALPNIPDEAQVLVLYGDVPLIRADTLIALLDAATQGLAILTVELSEPSGYGRILRGADRAILGIIEDKDASAEQRRITEVNTGVIAAPAQALRGWLAQVNNDNAKGEFYLTDIVAMAAAEGMAVGSVRAASADEVEGANDRAQLARLERVYQRGQADMLLADGVSLADPARIELRGYLHCGRDVFIDVGCVFEGDVTLADGVNIGPYCTLRDSVDGAHSRIASHSVLDQARVGCEAQIGPFARLRPGAELADRVHVGNFVEVKNTRIGVGSKANHLAYLGDGEVGADVNIGAGTIFCNYDGANKHRTVIEDGAFIGSDTQLVAPVRIGKNATVGAGSTINRDVPEGGLTICRARDQKTFASWRRPQKQPKKS